MEFEKEPLTWADFILIFPLIATEMVAAIIPNTSDADRRLEDIGSRLLDMGNACTNERSRVLILALAKQLIATEEGA